MSANDTGEVPAGGFARWLDDTRRARREGSGADVPCGTCNVCCRSSFFIHVAPDEADARAHIPKALLFKAPGLPAGHHLMGYDAQGRCPMLVDGACSIYAHRPRTCREFDCRLFAATGTTPIGGANSELAARVKRWRFAPDTNGDAQAQRALHAALAFVERHARALPEGFVPESPTQRALLAVEVYDAFLDLATGAEAIDIAALAPDAVAALARTVVEKRRAFEAARPKAPPAAKKRPR